MPIAAEIQRRLFNAYSAMLQSGGLEGSTLALTSYEDRRREARLSRVAIANDSDPWLTVGCVANVARYIEY